jgi:hypothetical protein
MSERPGSSSPQRHWFAPAATAAGVALVVTGVLLAVNRGPEPAAGRTPPAAEPPSAPDLLVRNGDEVVARGVVVAAPGRPVVFCPPMPETAMAHPPGQEPPPACHDDPRAVVVTGVDFERLGKPETRKGVSFGYAELRGIWRDRTIAVTGQGPYPEPDTGPDTGPVPAVDDEVPCPRPSGDWKRNKELGFVDHDPLLGFIARQPDRFGAHWVAYVDVDQEASDSAPDFADAKEILIVGVVTGDLDDARRELEPLYDGNLCVTRAEQSITRREQVTGELEALWTDHPEAIVGTAGQSSPNSLPAVDLVVMDQPIYDVLARIGWDQFDVDAAIKPVR